VLIERLLPQFADPEKAKVAITIQVDKEKVSATTVSELHAASDLPAKVAKFEITITEHDGAARIFYLWSKGPTGSPSAIANGESEAWAAGAIETARVFFARHRVPFYWAAGVPMGVITFMASLWFVGASLQNWKAAHFVPWSWIAAYGSVVAVKLLHGQISECQLVLRETESPLTRALPGLGFVVALASLVVAILAWLLPRAP
jgi:hypothetical protein